ncbi:MAG: hypothetical protein GY726_06020 [Proteobacteria bacterium]|nr:hypothetical protein [Pseudomonadota bacterium]
MSYPVLGDVSMVAHQLPFAGRETMHSETVSGGGEGLGKHEQAVPDNVYHFPLPGLGAV